MNKANFSAFSSTCIFNLNSGKFPYLHENGTINVKQDSTITYINPQQSTEQTHTENTSINEKEKLNLVAISLGIIIPFCVLLVVYGFYAFYRRSKPSLS